MSREVTALRQRCLDAGVSPTAIGDALSIRLVDRVLDGPEAGPTYLRVIEFLDRLERTGSYVPVAALTEAERYTTSQAAADEAFLAPRRAAKEAQARIDLWYAQDRERILEERALATARYVNEALDRVVLGMELRELRETAGLGLNEVAVLIGFVDGAMLDKMEHGRPLGTRRMKDIETIYRTLPKFTGRKVVAK
jgi:Helix-turn-helix domain